MTNFDRKIESFPIILISLKNKDPLHKMHTKLTNQR